MSESLLIDEYKALLNKKGIKEATGDILYPTGFLNFDFMNGYIAEGMTPDGKAYKYYNIGISDGSINMIISRTGGGKTTWCAQVAANIVRPFPQSFIIEENVEAGLNYTRRIALSGFTKEECEKRYVIHNEGISIEVFFNNVKTHIEEKIKHQDRWLYDTGHFDIYGNPIYKYMPTVIILDSLALLSSTSILEDDEIAGNMSGGAEAKKIAASIRAILPHCKKANVIIFMINHINSDIQINPYQAKKAQNIYLKQGETVPKGNMPMYASTNVIRIDDKKIKENEAFGFNGTLNSITLVKSRTAPPNTSTSLVHDPNIGFDPTLSLYMMLKEDGMINGAGVGCYFGDHNDCKFSQKNFKEKFEVNPELRKYFQEACEIDLINKINRIVNKSKAEEETIGCLMNNLLAARIEE